MLGSTGYLLPTPPPPIEPSPGGSGDLGLLALGWMGFLAPSYLPCTQRMTEPETLNPIVSSGCRAGFPPSTVGLEGLGPFRVGEIRV